MSIAELKAKIIEKVNIQSNNDKLQKVLEILDLDNSNSELNLSKHYVKVKLQFNDALEKLAKRYN